MSGGKDPCSLHEFQFEKFTELAIEDESFEWSPSDPMIRAQDAGVRRPRDYAPLAGNAAHGSFASAATTPVPTLEKYGSQLATKPPWSREATLTI